MYTIDLSATFVYRSVIYSSVGNCSKLLVGWDVHCKIANRLQPPQGNQEGV